MADTKLTTTLATTFALLDQFTSSLNVVPADDTAPLSDSPSPLPLLSTCATTLRAQTTKLSLLIITPPFTPSAISTLLVSLNEAILPSLLTAALLLTPTTFTRAYSAEAISLTKATLRDLRSLAQLVDARSKDSKPKSEPNPSQKSAVTEATGKIWEDCDELKSLAENGIGGFVVKKAEQYLELIKDAVKEIEEWDPEEVDDVTLDDEDDEEEDNHTSTTTENPSHPNQQIISTLKPVLLPLLTRLPQSLHVVLHQRLRKPPLHPQPTKTPTTKQRLTVDLILTLMDQTSTILDDLAERLYMHDAIGAMLTAEKARACVVQIVESVMRPVTGIATEEPAMGDKLAKKKEEEEPGKEGVANHGGADLSSPTEMSKEAQSETETKEDRYIKRALDWIKSVGLQS